jgi:hypothetical protein
MSSFKIKARNKKTGEVHDVWCLDNYFGKHKYGYTPNGGEGEGLDEEDFYREYETIEDGQS